MSGRARALSFGGSVALMVAGGVVGALVGGITGEAIAIAAISLGGVALVSLVFYEIGLSEDRDRARERRERQRPPRPPRPPSLPRRRRRG